MPAHSLMFCQIQGSRNCLTQLGALQPRDKLNPVFISRAMGNFGNVQQKDMAENLAYDIPIGVETAVIKEDMPIQQQIDKTIKPTNTALKVGFNRMIGDISDTLSGGRFIKAPLNITSRIKAEQKGQGIFDKISQAVSFIEGGIALKEDISDIADTGAELAFGPIGTYLSNIASEKFNKNPNWREGFPGEKHALIDTPWGLTRANYLGPGTNLLARLERGDPPVDGPNGLDAAAKEHDIAYGLARTAEDVRAADNKFLTRLSNVESSTKMKLFVRGLFNAKKLAENVGFLDPTKFTPQIDKELTGAGFSGYKSLGSISSENVMMGAGVSSKDISKFFKGKRDISGPLKILRSIAFNVPVIQEQIEETIEQFLPGQQLREQLMGNLKGGAPKQDEFSGHILAGGVPTVKSAYDYGIVGDRMAHGKTKGQPGGQILASILAGIVVPELISFVGKKIKKALSKKKKKR